MRSGKLIESFHHAFSGLGYLLRTQRNARIHASIALIVILVGWRLSLSRWEWVATALTIGFVLMAEAFNTVVEATVDLSTDEYHPLAKAAKDVSAGAVVLAAATAVIVGIFVLGPHLLARIR